MSKLDILTALALSIGTTPDMSGGRHFGRRSDTSCPKSITKEEREKRKIKKKQVKASKKRNR